MPRSLIDRRFDELKNDLCEAHRTIVELMAPEVSEELRSYHSCESWKDFSEWERGVIDFVIERAVPIPTGPHFEERAKCPLCGSGGTSPPTKGYVIPVGLELHLRDPCPVMKAALHLAHDHLRPKLDEEDLRAKVVLAARRKTEIVFLVDPFDQPRLIEEGCNSPRDEAGLTSAEARLSKLGFDISISKNVKSYRLESDTYLAYADPRKEGQISFIVFRKPVPKYRTAAKRRSFFMADWENMLDGWDNGLEQRFAKRLLEALRRLKISADGSGGEALRRPQGE